MKNTFKRTLALALAVVMLLSVSVIGVSAESTWDNGVNTDTVTIYEFWQEAYKGSYVYHSSNSNVNADIAAAYENSELNWMRYSESAGYSIFAAGRPYHEVTVGEGGASNAFYGLVIKNPGAGTYDLSLDYSKTSAGCVSVKAFLVAESVFAANSDTAWRYVIKNNMAGQNGVVYLGEFSCNDAEISDYSVHTFSTTVTLDAAEGTNYHLVFSADDGDDSVKSGSNKIYINQLALEKTTSSGSVSYDFFARSNGTTMYDATEGLASDYAAGTLNWKYENTFGNSVDEAGNVTGYYYHGLNSDGTTYNNGRSTFATAADGVVQWMTVNGWLALRIKAPGTGVYNVSLTHATNTRGASAANIYLFDAPSASASVSDIQALVDGAEAAQATTNFCGGTANGTSAVYGSPAVSSSFTYTFTKDQEYLLVVQAKVVSTLVSGYYWMFLSELTAEPIAAEIKNPEGASFDFNQAAGGTTMYDATAALASAYAAGTLNWKYENTHGNTVDETTGELEGYYYHQDTNGDNSSFNNGRSTFATAADGIVQWATSGGWLALRIKASVSGSYNVSLTHATNTNGASTANIYLFDAPATSASVEDIQTLVDGAEAAQATTNFCNTASTTKNTYGNPATSTSFTHNFTKGQEYLLVVQSTQASTQVSGYYWMFLSDLNLEPVNAYESAGQYTTLRAAINAAEADAVAGATVTMLADAEVVDLGVTCNIDLNGKKLTVYGDMTAVGTVSDNTDGTGVLTVAGEMILAGEQAQLPLYDAAAGGYGLYKVTWGENNQSEAAVDNAKKFWFQLFFENAAAYDLIATGTSGLSIGVMLDWGTDSKAFDFVDKTEGTAAAFAAGWGEFMKTASTPWIWVNVLNYVEGATLTPVIEANGAQISCDAIA